MLNNARAAMLQSVKKQLKLSRQRLESAAGSRVLQSPTAYLQDRRMVLDHLTKRLQAASDSALSKKRQRFAALSAGLDAMSPLKVLGRGYSVVASPDGAVIRSVRQLAPGKTVTLRLSDGSAKATVNTVREEEHGTVQKL